MKSGAYQFHTLGCKLNFAESSFLGRQLTEAGFHKAAEGEEPDVCIINSCTVTDTADKKGRQLIHRIRREHPNAFLVVTGCYAQLRGDEIAAMDGVDLVLGANDKFKLADYLSRNIAHQPVISDTRHMTPFYGACSKEDRTRYFLKIQDGCDCFCSYCAIPFARGRSRSGRIDDIVRSAHEVVENGGKEIILTGVNIGDFGKNTGERLIDLLHRLDAVEGLHRIRISSIEPDLLTDEIIDFTAGSKLFMPHFHIPLQSGSDKVLRIMHRRYDTALFAAKISRIRQVLPNAFIGIDIIAGMRGETAADFEDSYRFVSGLEFAQLHVFPYSERAGTAALRQEGPVPEKEKKARTVRLIELSAQHKAAFVQAQTGTRHEVLWEASRKRGLLFGFTDNYIRVRTPYDASKINQLEEITLNEEHIAHDEV